MNSAVVCDYHVTVTSKVRFVNFGSMHSSVNRAFPWKTVHKRLNHVKLSYTCKYPIKRTFVWCHNWNKSENCKFCFQSFDLSKFIYFIEKIGSYIRLKLKIRISSPRVRNSFLLSFKVLNSFHYAPLREKNIISETRRCISLIFKMDSCKNLLLQNLQVSKIWSILAAEP
jgi:hypothetical protein